MVFFTIAFVVAQAQADPCADKEGLYAYDYCVEQQRKLAQSLPSPAQTIRVASPLARSRWTKVAGTDRMTWFADVTSIRRSGSSVAMSYLTHFSSVQDSPQYLSGIAIFDCYKRLVRVIDLKRYTANGKFAGAEPPSGTTVIGGLFDDLSNVACQAMRGISSTAVVGPNSGNQADKLSRRPGTEKFSLCPRDNNKLSRSLGEVIEDLKKENHDTYSVRYVRYLVPRSAYLVGKAADVIGESYTYKGHSYLGSVTYVFPRRFVANSADEAQWKEQFGFVGETYPCNNDSGCIVMPSGVQAPGNITRVRLNNFQVPKVLPYSTAGRAYLVCEYMAPR